MKGSAAFLFPGQGSQYPGMGLDFLESGSPAVRELFSLAGEITGRDMAALLREGDAETFGRSDVVQPAITLVNLAAAAFLRERGIVPAALAGHSLGEYAALASAGVIDDADALRLVRERGTAMQAAADTLNAQNSAGDGAAGMAAVLGPAPEEVEALIARWQAEGFQGLYGANYNSPRQTVVSGTGAALRAAEKKFAEAGAKRFLRLNVAGPFHSPLMRQAADLFAPVLEGIPFRDPAVPLFSNVTGRRILSGAEAKTLAVRQICEGVRWTAIEAAMREAGGFSLALETGPGKVLQGLWKDTGTEIPCTGAGTAAGAAGAAEKILNGA